MGGLLTASVTLTKVGNGEEAHQHDLTLQYQKAGEQIEDPEIKSYNELLIEEIGPHLTSPDKPGVEGYLPDIEEIYHESLTRPFQQAGQQIEDPELNAFYDRFIGEIGLDK